MSDRQPPISDYYANRPSISATDMNRIEQRLHKLETTSYQYPVEIQRSAHKNNVRLLKYITEFQYAKAGEDIDPNVSDQTWKVNLSYKEAVSIPSDTEIWTEYTVDTEAPEDSPNLQVEVINPLKLAAKEGDDCVICKLERGRGYWLLLDVKVVDTLAKETGLSDTTRTILTVDGTDITPGELSAKPYILDTVNSNLEIEDTTKTTRHLSKYGIPDKALLHLQRDRSTFEETLALLATDQSIPICYASTEVSTTLSEADNGVTNFLTLYPLSSPCETSASFTDMLNNVQNPIKGEQVGGRYTKYVAKANGVGYWMILVKLYLDISMDSYPVSMQYSGNPVALDHNHANLYCGLSILKNGVQIDGSLYRVTKPGIGVASIGLADLTCCLAVYTKLALDDYLQIGLYPAITQEDWNGAVYSGTATPAAYTPTYDIVAWNRVFLFPMNGGLIVE